MTRKMVHRIVLGAFVVGAMGLGTTALARRPPSGGGGCPRDFACYDLWDPVTCADGITYSNQCYADRACAPGPCVSAGGGPVEL